jgi:hypothetical protein
MQPDVLNAHQVLAGRNVLLNGPLQTILLPAAPGSVVAGARGVAKASLHHLDPVTRPVIAVDGAWGLGDVDKSRARMLDELAVD